MGEMVESTEAGALSSDPEELQQIIENAEEEIEKLQEYISQEEDKAMRYYIIYSILRLIEPPVNRFLRLIGSNYPRPKLPY